MENVATPSIKDLIKDNQAFFSHMIVDDQKLYYKVDYMGFTYEFGIPIADLGEATVSKQEKAITLMRYLRKAMESGEIKKYPKCAPKAYSIMDNAIFSHFRTNVIYYTVENADGEKFSFPIRREDLESNAMNKISAYEDKESLKPIIEKAKEANEFHRA